MTTTTDTIPIVVDDELKGLIPPLTDAERQQLEENLVREGCRDPLVIWNNGAVPVLLDGHHRWEICQRLAIPFDTVPHPTVANRDDARLFIIDNQCGRRNLNIYQRTRLALQKKEAIAAQAKNRQREAGGALPQISAKAPIETRKAIAKAAGVSHDTVSKVERILETADSRTLQRLERGMTSVNEAYKGIRHADKLEERERLLAEATLECPDGEGIITGDAAVLHQVLEDNSVDLFLCDPPWNEEGIIRSNVYGDLSRLAFAKLKPGGFCLAYTGSMFLPQAIAGLSAHLEYWWLFTIPHAGGYHRIWKRKVMAMFRPVLVFAKPPVSTPSEWVFDSVKGGGTDKRFHEWGQNVEEITEWIEKLTQPGDLIVDPYCGGGTVPLACLATKRRWLATEIDPKNAAMARKRIREAVSI